MFLPQFRPLLTQNFKFLKIVIKITSVCGCTLYTYVLNIHVLKMYDQNIVNCNVIIILLECIFLQKT